MMKTVPPLNGGGASCVKRNVPALLMAALILFLLAAYRILGLEGDQVLLGLSCRNTAFLMIAILIFRYLLKRGGRGKRPFREYLYLIIGTLFTAAFLYGQSNVVLDLIVPDREAVLTDCVLSKPLLPSFLTGYECILSGTNANGYTKILPLTGELTSRVKEELKARENVNVVFKEHVRRVVLVRDRSGAFPQVFDMPEE